MTTVTTSPGVIRADETYTKSEFFRRAEIGQSAYRTARRKGLKIISTAGRVYVRGRDWIAYLDSIADASNENAGANGCSH